MGWLKDIFNGIMKFLKKVWKAIGPLLVIAIIVFVALSPFLVTYLGVGSAWALALPSWMAWLPSVVSFFAAMGPIGAAIAALGLSYALAPEATEEVIGDIAGIVGGAVGTVVGAATGAVAGALFGDNLGLWLLLGVGAYFIITADKKEQAVASSTTRGVNSKTRQGDTSRTTLNNMEGQLNG